MTNHDATPWQADLYHDLVRQAGELTSALVRLGVRVDTDMSLTPEMELIEYWAAELLTTCRVNLAAWRPPASISDAVIEQWKQLDLLTDVETNGKL